MLYIYQALILVLAAEHLNAAVLSKSGHCVCIQNRIAVKVIAQYTISL